MSAEHDASACIMMYQDQLENIMTLLSRVSVATSGVCLVLRLCDRRSFRFPSRIATAITAVALLFSANLSIGGFTRYSQVTDSDNRATGLCVAQGLLFQFLSSLLVSCALFISLITYEIVVLRANVRRLRHRERVFLMATLVVSAILTALPLCFRGAYGASSVPACWLTSYKLEYGFFYWYLALGVLLTVATSVCIAFRIWELIASEHQTAAGWLTAGQRSNTTDRGQSQESQLESQQLQTGMRYTLGRHLIFMLLFAWIFMSVIVDAVNGTLEKAAGSIDRRFPSTSPCATNFVATWSTGLVGVFVAAAFMRWPEEPWWSRSTSEGGEGYGPALISPLMGPPDGHWSYDEGQAQGRGQGQEEDPEHGSHRAHSRGQKEKEEEEEEPAVTDLLGRGYDTSTRKTSPATYTSNTHPT